MLHFFQLFIKRTLFPVLCSLFSIFSILCVSSDQLWADEATISSQKNIISSISSQQDGDDLTLYIRGSATPTFTVYELFKPSRIVVDVADAELTESANIALPENKQISLATRTITDTTPTYIRFEFTLGTSLPFNVTQQQNDIVVKIENIKLSATTSISKNIEGSATVIEEIKINTTPSETRVTLLANGTISDYTYDVLDKKGETPSRLYIDLNNISGDTLLKEQNVGTSLDKIRVATRGSGLRLVLDSSMDLLFPFQIAKVKNGLEILIEENKHDDQLSTLINQQQTIESQLPQVDPLKHAGQVPPLESGSVQSSTNTLQDAFSFAGYKKARITVDFYKIDLHNVFRLLREVSETNIVVDEAVSGSLTLALNDVPWDFALDIILNLKDLQKEERFNTIIILPKSKSFAWPSRAENNLSFEADETISMQEAIIIQQRENVPKEILAAKELIGQGRSFEKREEYENAVNTYEKALENWPDNTKLANRIASIYLVQLRQNAKAAYFAKIALKGDPKNTSAALNAAIALANMQNRKEAQEYFNHSVSDAEPKREALLSYAAFSEQSKKYDSALKLLKKHDTLNGETLNSMLAAARIYDKQGQNEIATEKYKAILLSGYRIPPDLAKYIKGRIALSQSM